MRNTFFDRRLEKSSELAAAGVHDGPSADAGQRPSGSGEPTLDPQALENLRQLQHEGDPDVLRQVVEAFLDSCPPLLETMQQVISRQESLEAVRIAAHTLKSSCAMVGAVHLAQLCQQLEVVDGDTAWRACRQILEKIEDAYHLVCGTLLQECEKDGFPITKS